MQRSIGSSTSAKAIGQRTSLTWVLLALILGLCLRRAYIAQIRSAPDFKNPRADASLHDYWARGPATGNWTPSLLCADPHIPEVPHLRPPGYPYVLGLIYKLLGGSYLQFPRIVALAEEDMTA